MKRTADKQQQITAFMPERVKKTRDSNPDGASSAKRQKVHHDHPAIPSIPKLTQPSSVPSSSAPLTTPTKPAYPSTKTNVTPVATVSSAPQALLPAKRRKESVDEEDKSISNTNTPISKSPSASITTGPDPKRQKISSTSQSKKVRSVSFAPLPTPHSISTTTAHTAHGIDSSTDSAVIISNAMPPLPPSTTPVLSNPDAVQVQKKKWRLSELIKKDREAKRLKAQSSESGRSSFVFVPTTLEIANRNEEKTSAPVTPSTSSPSEQQSEPSTPLSKSRISPSLTSTPKSFSRPQHSAIPGAEALLHDRSMLPDSFSLLLDVLTSMETAFALLRTRHTRPTVFNVREIVQRDTRRDFKLRTLAQLAALVPECVAVTEPSIGKPSSLPKDKKPSDMLLIRLDDPESSGKFDARVSELGDGPARVRRAFLHRRLLQVVREKHAEFVKNKGDDDANQSAVWHPDFEPNKNVPTLPAPPLCDENGDQIGVNLRTSRSINELLPADGSLPSSSTTPTRRRLRSNSKDDTEKEKESIISRTLANISRSPSSSSSDRKDRNVGKESVGKESVGKESVVKEVGDADEDDVDGGIPKSLLARVRSRAKAKEQRSEKADEERTANSSLLSKLPCTMDSINTVLRTERRSAMGWKQLVQKVATVHPKKWPKEDLERQMDAITKLATDWCSKVELKSSRGGFAFRVVSDKAFAQARIKVMSTESLAMD